MCPEQVTLTVRNFKAKFSSCKKMLAKKLAKVEFGLVPQATDLGALFTCGVIYR